MSFAANIFSLITNILPCIVSDDFGLGTSRDLSEYSRYRMVGDEARGEWNLVIVNATVEDDAKYQVSATFGI